MAVRVCEITGMAAPKYVLRRLHNLTAGGLRFGQDGAQVFLGAHIVGDRHATKTDASRPDRRILGQRRSRIKRQRHPAGLEKHNIALAG